MGSIKQNRMRFFPPLDGEELASGLSALGHARSSTKVWPAPGLSPKIEQCRLAVVCRERVLLSPSVSWSRKAVFEAKVLRWRQWLVSAFDPLQTLALLPATAAMRPFPPFRPPLRFPKADGLLSRH